jgi:hypothetical protein
MSEKVARKGTRWRLAEPALALCLVLLAVASAHAFWPFSSAGGDGGSGLDLNKGYDVNTVTTVKGRVITIDPEDGGGPVLVELRNSSGAVLLVAGPRWFWSEKGISVQVGDEITARGSLTEGKDGRRYLLAQKLANQRTNEEILLRGDDGVPVWTNLKQSPGPNRPPDITTGPKPGRAGAGPRGRR